MGGGLMQLVAYGAQDIYLTGNPQITFFKVVYRRHTNFSMECISQTFDGTVGTGESSVSATIARNGDLIHSMHLDSVLTTATQSVAGGSYSNWTNNTGHAYLKEVELEIGGQRIDKHYGHWLDVWNELTDHDESEYIGLNKHKAKGAYLRSGAVGDSHHTTWQLFIPLKFWFCRNPGLALPLIALQYHEVKVKCVFRALAALINSDSTTAPTLSTAPTTTLWVDYIYLDTDERRRFAQQSHEYLIEQLQFEQNTASGSTTLNLNHPVKELIWNIQQPEAVAEYTTGTSATADNAFLNVAGASTTAGQGGNDYFNYEGTGSTASNWSTGGAVSSHSFDKVKLQLNGHDRFTERKAVYFNQVTPRQAGHRVPEKHIYVYSFALKPEEHQPSGTCNFSRIDNAVMEHSAHPARFAVDAARDGRSAGLNFYAINYNVLRVMSGMGGLAYSN